MLLGSVHYLSTEQGIEPSSLPCIYRVSVQSAQSQVEQQNDIFMCFDSQVHTFFSHSTLLRHKSQGFFGGGVINMTIVCLLSSYFHLLWFHSLNMYFNFLYMLINFCLLIPVFIPNDWVYLPQFQICYLRVSSLSQFYCFVLC